MLVRSTARQFEHAPPEIPRLLLGQAIIGALTGIAWLRFVVLVLERLCWSLKRRHRAVSSGSVAAASAEGTPNPARNLVLLAGEWGQKGHDGPGDVESFKGVIGQALADGQVTPRP